GRAGDNGVCVCSRMPMRYMRQTPAHSSKKREQAEKEARHETDQIESCPGHIRLLLFSPSELTDAGLSASNRRSARSGVSRIAPSSRKQLRVSVWRAVWIITWLISGSLAKRSAPCSSHTSSFPSVVRKSEISSVW